MEKKCLSRVSGKLSCTVLRRGRGSNPSSLFDYTSHDFRNKLNELGITQSMNSAAGRCHDNAKCESMWARGKEEMKACYDIKLMTCMEIKALIYRYYMDYWNNRRICSAIGGVPPVIKRAAYYEKQADLAA